MQEKVRINQTVKEKVSVIRFPQNSSPGKKMLKNCVSKSSDRVKYFLIYKYVHSRVLYIQVGKIGIVNSILATNIYEEVKHIHSPAD